MDCKKAQRLFDDLARDRLAPECAVELRQHLTDCTDCRVLQQRAARLQRLLALKRYEHPAPAYFDGFLTEFHRRLLAETQPQIAWWERALEGLDGFLSAESMQVWRYAVATTLGVTMIVGLMWTGLGQSGETANDASAPNVAANAPVIVTPQISPSASVPTLAMAPSQFSGIWRVSPAADELGLAEMPERPPAVMSTELATPQYVLDRISATPVTYDVASVHF
ncbi:MAG TPA: hypothetical protein VL171_18190 [Verrucomicrobiae bacterium]|nr:hypothetical protein [Verrucomicrobiae bacterium]